MRYLVVGQARSGTTALYSLISQSLERAAGYFRGRISEIPALPPKAVVKVILEHETAEALSTYATAFERCIILVRGRRDNIVRQALFSPIRQGKLPDMTILSQNILKSSKQNRFVKA